jgi:ABC-type amino acid transport substrate-binding protein
VGKEVSPMRTLGNTLLAGSALAVLALAGCGSAAALPAPKTPAPTVTMTVFAPAKTITVTRTATPPPATTAAAPAPQPQPQFANATAVVTQFYQDITDHNYTAAWALGGNNVSGGVGYDAWVAGYGTTESISLGTFSYFGSGQVQTVLSALQTSGAVYTYTGTYTVQNGIIVAAHIVQG